jgi:hypothetical protein
MEVWVQLLKIWIKLITVTGDESWTDMNQTEVKQA